MWTSEQELMAAILEQAKEDLYLHPNAVENSLYFFLSQDNCPCSFLRICEVLTLNPKAVLKPLQERINYCIRFKKKSRPANRRKRVRTINYIELFEKPKEDK